MSMYARVHEREREREGEKEKEREKTDIKRERERERERELFRLFETRKNLPLCLLKVLRPT